MLHSPLLATSRVLNSNYWTILGTFKIFLIESYVLLSSKVDVSMKRLSFKFDPQE